MTKFLIKNIIIFVFAIFLFENLASGELILPKPQPKIKELIKEEIILPKSQSNIDEQLKEEISQSESLSNIDELPKKETLLPKSKPTINEETKLLLKQKKYILPKKKPGDQTSGKVEVAKTQKESSVEKIISEIDDTKLISPKKKPLIYQKPIKKILTKSKYFSKNDFKLAKKIFSEIEKKKMD